MKRALPLLIIGGVLVASLAGAWYWRRSASGNPLSVPEKGSRQQSKSGNPKLGAVPAHSRGLSDATVMIEEFADFECGGCGAVHLIMKDIENEFGSRIVVVFREYPLAVHKNGMTAAQAAESAGLQGKFWEMHDLLYDNQKTWHQLTDVRPLFREYASRLGIAVDRFERDMSSEMVNSRISLDRERAGWIGVNSTPTAFINGREIPFEALTSREKLRDLIRAELSVGPTKN